MRIVDHLKERLRGAAVFNPDIQSAPACILWPDRDRQWESAVPLLLEALPELAVLGEYAPEKRSGPAIWLRCAIAGRAGDVSLPADRPPILYLPGVGRQDLRAVENCPDSLKPLAELQYRGVIWSQNNTKDWTILAFLKSDQGGLGLDPAQDGETKNAMQLALCALLDEDLDALHGRRLDKQFFNTLLTGGDPVREILQWLDRGEAFRAERSENEWKAFRGLCKSQFFFDPEKEGVLTGSTRLAQREGPWHTPWERYCEAPKRYPNIPSQIRKCAPPKETVFWNSDTELFDGWPQWNDDREAVLRKDLLALAGADAPEARARIRKLEEDHSRRRGLVWAELGEAPLACALEHLAVVAELTGTGLAAGTIGDLEKGYAGFGWKVDDSAIRAFAGIESPADLEAVKSAVRSVYLPWLEESSRYFQKLVCDTSYPGGLCLTARGKMYGSGECVLFVDGLRFDAAKRLAGLLSASGVMVAEEHVWAALPSVTATGKPAVSPVACKIRGEDVSPEFEPVVGDTGQPLKGGYHLKKLLTEAGWTLLDSSAGGDGKGMAWCELGDIDSEGHDHGWKLARRIDAILSEIRDRTTELLEAGWKRVHIVTDHGWLLLPGGLPKAGLPTVLTENKWGRCASLKPGASADVRLFPWYWNPNCFFALADGVSCFRNGLEYTHGGLSLQECLTLRLTAAAGRVAEKSAVVITDVVWKGLRCTVAIEGESTGLFLDIRRQGGDPSSSLVINVKPVKEGGTASVVVEDDGLEGQEAVVVLVGDGGELVSQIGTVIGGGN